MTNNFIVSVTSWHLAFNCIYQYFGISTFNNVMRCCVYVTQWSTNWLKCTQNDTWYSYAQESLPLGYQNLNTWHLPLVCSITSSPHILKRKTIMSSISICYVECHIAHKVLLLKVTYVESYWQLVISSQTNNIIMAISEQDTLRPLGIKFGSFTFGVCDTKYHKQCSRT